MDAKADNLFDPMRTITQGEFADTFLLLVYGWNAFSDDSKEAKEKFIAGIPVYDRDTPITRQVVATMIHNLKQIHDLKPIQPNKANKVKLLDVADD